MFVVRIRSNRIINTVQIKYIISLGYSQSLQLLDRLIRRVWCTILLSESVRTDSLSECDASHSSKSILRVDIPIDWNLLNLILLLCSSPTFAKHSSKRFVALQHSCLHIRLRHSLLRNILNSVHSKNRAPNTFFPQHVHFGKRTLYTLV